MKIDGSQFLVEKSHPLFSRIHLAAPSSIRLFCSGDGEAFLLRSSAQDAEHYQQSRVIETVVMLAIGLSMASVILGNLNNDDSV